jgi:DNA-binding LacI/PurR family transcriptional regulator
VDVGIPHEVINDIEDHTLSRREVYITLMEEDLVNLIKKTKQLNFKPIRDIGIISYNENPIKEILLDGITVISTDFEEMGKVAAQQILSGKSDRIENPFRVIVRDSL